MPASASERERERENHCDERVVDVESSNTCIRICGHTDAQNGVCFHSRADLCLERDDIRNLVVVIPLGWDSRKPSHVIGIHVQS